MTGLEPLVEKKEGKCIHTGIAFNRENGRAERVITYFCCYMCKYEYICMNLNILEFQGIWVDSMGFYIAAATPVLPLD